MTTYVELVFYDGVVLPWLYLLRGELEAGIPPKFIRVHHLEHIHTRVDLDTQWAHTCPLQIELYFVGLGPRAEASVRPDAGHREHHDTPRPTYAHQFQSRVGMAGNGD